MYLKIYNPDGDGFRIIEGIMDIAVDQFTAAGEFKNGEGFLLGLEGDAEILTDEGFMLAYHEVPNPSEEAISAT